MPIEIRELEILAEPRLTPRGPAEGGPARSTEPDAREIERGLVAWHREMVLRADRLRAD